MGGGFTQEQSLDSRIGRCITRANMPIMLFLVRLFGLGCRDGIVIEWSKADSVTYREALVARL
jgi:hypothetical protein